MNRPGGQFLTIAGLSHAFGANRALSDIALAVASGELIALLGPSGCGKTTLLKMIAGFLTPDRGDIWFDGDRMNDVPANRRRIGMVFQNYALFPHMSVADNIAYGLRAGGARGPQIDAKVRELMALVKLDAFARRYPSELSGGQQQRVALARALAIDPRMVLLDEPFSALDKNLRLDMQIEIKRVIKAYGVTTIMVTHDQEEALSMADRVVVMNAGRIEQIAKPQELYDRPATVFVNGFIGHANLFRGFVRGPETVELLGGTRLGLPLPHTLHASEEVLVSVRPENLGLCSTEEPDALGATVRAALPLGAADIVEAVTGEGEAVRLVLPRHEGRALPEPGEAVRIRVHDFSRVGVFAAAPPEAGTPQNPGA